MPNPFEYTASQAQTYPTPGTVKLATAPQLSLIASLITERVWHDAAPAYAARVATISATMYVAERLVDDPAANVAVAAATITDPTDVAGSFAELLAASQADAERNRDAETVSQRKPLTRKGASALIDWLQGRPVQNLTASQAASAATNAAVAGRRPSDATFGTADLPSADAVPAGRYAIDTADGAVNETAFYRVDRPTEGRWAGRVFVKLITGGDEQRLSWATSKTVLAKIADAGAQAAMLRYGREIGNCGHCGRQLTNDESRAVGIGPVCRAKMGY